MSSYMAAEARISLLNLFQGAVLVVAANLAFFLLVFVVDASINHRILYEKLASAAALGVIDDRDYPADLATYSDRYTDCVALGLNLVDEPDRKAFGLMRDSEIAKVDGLNACSALMMMVKDKKTVSAMNYSRYWHGYQILSKPFLRFGDIRNLRYILACLVIGAVFAFSTIIAIGFTGTVSGVFQGLWFGLGYLLLTDGANLGNVFTHSLSLLAIFSMPLAVFWAIKAGVRRPLFLMAVAVGSVNAFFDLLFNPPLGLSTLVVATVAASADKNLSARDIFDHCGTLIRVGRRILWYLHLSLRDCCAALGYPPHNAAGDFHRWHVPGRRNRRENRARDVVGDHQEFWLPYVEALVCRLCRHHGGVCSRPSGA